MAKPTMKDKLHHLLDRYLDGEITLMELLTWLLQHYNDKQAENESSCLTCGSDLSKRLG